jgi:hypothetical protein
MKKIIYVIVLGYSFLSCNEEKKVKDIENKTVNDKLTEDSTTINFENCNLCIDFLESYQKNYDLIYEKDFINYEGNFSIDFDNFEVFIYKTQLNKYFTENYITSFKKKIKNIDQRLKKTPQDDGVIEGLESDVFLKTQEIEDCLNQIMNNRIVCKQIKQNLIEVDFGNKHTLIFLITNNKINEIELKENDSLNGSLY